MKIYVITNGYMSDAISKVIVCAANKERALELASAKFKEDARRVNAWRGSYLAEEPQREERYWTRLTVLDVFDNLDEEWASEVDQIDNH